jgi:hypothetical protein
MTGLQTKADTPPKQQPHRFRVSVPAADEAVVEWMNLQDNQSLSVRMLIRESIERLGYVDVVNRPVAQLPKRGRPAGSADEGTAAEEETAAGSALRTSRQQGPAAASTELDLSHRGSAGPELLGIALEAPALARASQPAQSPQRESTPPVPEPLPSEPEQPSSEPLEVNDIFSTLR